MRSRLAAHNGRTKRRWTRRCPDEQRAESDAQNGDQRGELRRDGTPRDDSHYDRAGCSWTLELENMPSVTDDSIGSRMILWRIAMRANDIVRRPIDDRDHESWHQSAPPIVYSDTSPTAELGQTPNTRSLFSRKLASVPSSPCCRPAPYRSCLPPTYGVCYQPPCRMRVQAPIRRPVRFSR